MAVPSESTDHDAHRKWKHLAAPMYDWMTNHHLVWPGLACRYYQSRCLIADGGAVEMLHMACYFADLGSGSKSTLPNIIK